MPDDALITSFCQHIRALCAGDAASFVRLCEGMGSIVDEDTPHGPPLDDGPGQAQLVVRRRDGLTVGIACRMGVSDVVPQVVLALFGPWGFQLGWVATATRRLQREETARFRRVRQTKQEASDASAS